MKFNHLSTRLTGFSFDEPLSLNSPDLEEFYAPLIEALRATGAENWEGFFWLCTNHLVNSAESPDRVRIYAASTERMRLSLEHGHNVACETWGAGPLARVARKLVTTGTIDLTVTCLPADTPADTTRQPFSLVLSDSIDAALAMARADVNSGTPFFMVTKMEGDDVGKFVEFHKSLGDAARVGAWQDIREASRNVLIAALTFGGNPYEV
jgi:hypothetical protein